MSSHVTLGGNHTSSFQNDFTKDLSIFGTCSSKSNHVQTDLLINFNGNCDCETPITLTKPEEELVAALAATEQDYELVKDDIDSDIVMLPKIKKIF